MHISRHKFFPFSTWFNKQTKSIYIIRNNIGKTYKSHQYVPALFMVMPPHIITENGLINTDPNCSFKTINRSKFFKEAF